ncbi:MAG: hypothetical protein WBA89_21025 [Microcoleus sp.]
MGTAEQVLNTDNLPRIVGVEAMVLEKIKRATAQLKQVLAKK